MHIPVLQKEILEILEPKTNENFIDATFGLGGHALELLKRNKPAGKVLGIELDPISIKTFKEINNFSHDALERLTLVNDSYTNLENIIADQKFESAKGILFDLGLSSWHFEESNRGFSFRRDEALDMRFNPDRNQLTAFEIVNYWKPEQIETALKEFGQEQFAKSIVQNLIRVRSIRPIRTTLELNQIIMDSVPGWYKRRKIHPATKTFQALRIAVNDELENIKQGIATAAKVLPKQGKIAVISFHSLEDKIVKTFFKEQEKENKLKIITKKPITASALEIKTNTRSRSAKLRAAQII